MFSIKTEQDIRVSAVKKRERLPFPFVLKRRFAEMLFEQRDKMRAIRKSGAEAGVCNGAAAFKQAYSV